MRVTDITTVVSLSTSGARTTRQAALWATNIRPVPDIQGETESEAVPNGDAYTQWAEEGLLPQ